MCFVSVSFHHVGVVVLLLHYISGFTKHIVELVDITEKDEDSKKVQRKLTYCR